MSDETKFEIGNKAELLYYSIFDLTTNRQHYPLAPEKPFLNIAYSMMIRCTSPKKIIRVCK